MVWEKMFFIEVMKREQLWLKERYCVDDFAIQPNFVMHLEEMYIYSSQFQVNRSRIGFL